MDLTKTTLRDLDASKADKLINENKKRDISIHESSASQINHKSVQEEIGKYDFKTSPNFLEVEKNDDKKNTCHLNNKQQKIIENRDFQNKNGNTAEGSIRISPNINALPTSKGTLLIISALEEESNKSSNNENILKSAESTFLKADKNIEEVEEFRKEIKKVEVSEDVETVEKISEMIGVSDIDMDANSTKTNKRLQLLMSRNPNLQTCNSPDDNNASGSYIEPKDYKIKFMNDQRNKKRKCVLETQKILHGFQFNTQKNKSNELYEENFLEKSRFEEIEDKLEQMFAGIEDEKLINTPPDDKNMPKKANDSSEKYLDVDCVGTKDVDYVCTDGNSQLLCKDNSLKYDISILNKSSLPTKAAKKSTTSLPNTENKKELNLLLRDQKSPSGPKSMFYLKTVAPRRRLSIGINKELLKHSVKSKDKMVEENDANNMRQESLTPLAQNLHREVKQIRKNVLKNKIKNNDQNKCSKFKKELTYIKKNNCNKKIIRKSEASIKTDQSRQNIKQSRMQCLLFSENDIEEKQLHTRDSETKNRSPFVLIKGNGNISVINTVTPDDCNEKFTRSKKSSNCVYERKTVKGCHSSTLSNRYDADTADSSWKCIFCKIGPHKKGLGDLFGPYIISSDCDEYRSIKDSLEKLQKLRRNDSQLLNFSNKSVKFLSDSSISHIRNISESNYEHVINIYASGMSQVSVDCYEIWVHEECAVWAPNIYMVGSRLAGLEEDTWNSIRNECVYCLKQGALLCCLQRDCKTTSHVPCAREFKWLLNESKFWVYCSKHALQKHLNKN